MENNQHVMSEAVSPVHETHGMPCPQSSQVDPSCGYVYTQHSDAQCRVMLELGYNMYHQCSCAAQRLLC